jgi:hypothetical protein
MCLSVLTAPSPLWLLCCCVVMMTVVVNTRRRSLKEKVVAGVRC